MRPSAIAVSVMAAAAFSACDGDDDPERRAATTARDVATAVQALERAIARRDFDAVCDRILTRAVREQAGGKGCPDRLRRTSRGLRRPRIRIQDVRIRGSRAEVRVVTSAQDQAPARDVIQLRRERGRWRVAALGR